MRSLRNGTIAVLALATWFGFGASVDTRLSLRLPEAAAQGTLTPPGGQPRVTAPGGLRGRALRRSHHRHRHRHR